MSIPFSFGRKVLTLFLFLYIPMHYCSAQDCDSRLFLHFSNPSAKPVAVKLFFKNSERTLSFNSSIMLSTLCPGQYRIVLLQAGYLPLDTSFTLAKSLDLILPLIPRVKELKELEIHEDHLDQQGRLTLQSSQLNASQWQANAGKPLGEMLKEASGVSSLQSGPTISKPVIHGLHSNRVVLINNGIRLESQQWGAEHAPEIDPFNVVSATVLKGAASLRYGSDAIAGVVLLQPKTMDFEKGTRGEVVLNGMSNGRMGAASARIEHAFGGKFKGMGIRIQGTLKDAGNIKTPTYYLKNTGMCENDVSATWMYTNKRVAMEISGSIFKTQIGIFTGSHVGNLKDLEAALQSVFPKDSSGFSRKIERGFQEVKHETFKARFCYHLNEYKQLEIVYGLQRNHRQEYDSGLPLSTNPAILNAAQADFLISTNTLDVLYSEKLNGLYSLSIGASLLSQGNVFKGLEYRALIPNFRNNGAGSFIALSRKKKRLIIEAGLRYDYRWLECYRLDYTTLETFATLHQFQNGSFSLGGLYQFNEKFSIQTNVGSAWRAPNVNELYGNGVHQSAASFEIGDSTLLSERAYNAIISGLWESSKSRFEIGIYRNQLDHFIFLKPLLVPVITIAGAYPAFQQTQVNAVFTGLDFDFKTILWRSLKIGGKLALIQGYNRTIHDYLVYTPSNRGDMFLMIEGNANERGKKSYVKLSAQYVARQNHVPSNSDYVAPPADYFLMNFDAGLSVGKKHPIDLGFSIYNVFNTQYREYLNRFRYFANEQGRSFVLRISVPFTLKK